MKCPTCESPAPYLHPAVQHEGEVVICKDDFHKTEGESWLREQIIEVMGTDDDEKIKQDGIDDLRHNALKSLTGMDEEQADWEEGD